MVVLIIWPFREVFFLSLKQSWRRVFAELSALLLLGMLPPTQCAVHDMSRFPSSSRSALAKGENDLSWLMPRASSVILAYSDLGIVEKKLQRR